MANKLYGSTGGLSNEVTKMYGSTGGLSSNVIKGYCSVNGLSKLFWDNDILYNRYLVCQSDVGISSVNVYFDNYIIIDTTGYSYLNVSLFNNNYETLANAQLQYDDNGTWVDVENIDISSSTQSFDVSSYNIVRLYFTVKPPVRNYGAIHLRNITLSNTNTEVGIYNYNINKIVLCHADTYFSYSTYLDNQFQIDTTGYSYFNIGAFRNSYNQLTRAKLQYKNNGSWYDIANLQLTTSRQTYNVANYKLVRLFITVRPPVAANGEISLENVSLSN